MRDVIEACLLWGGDDVIGVAVAEPRVNVRLRHLARLGLPIFGDDPLVVATLEGERVVLLHESIVRDGVALRLRVVDREAEKLSWQLGELGELRVASGVLFAAMLHAGLLVMAFLVRATPFEEEQASLVDLKAWTAALEAHEHPIADSEPGAGDAPRSEEPGTPTKARTPSPAGTVAKSRQGVTQKAHGDAQEPLHDRRSAEAALAFGMIGIINIVGGSSSGKSAFTDYEGPSATGNIFGATIEDAMGVGGATLSGWGDGGGGPGAGIGINGVSGRCDAQCMAHGTAGRVGGAGIGLGGGHATKAPSLRCGYEDPTEGHVGCSMQVNGRLPPEAIQRVVRQSFGRLRGCYESGLQRNPALAGRIAVKFVIGRDGEVSTASAGEHDLRDEQVVSCITRGFGVMSFPPPTGGIVTVVYPITFSS